MGIGFRKLLRKISVEKRCFSFGARKFLFGFEDANITIKDLDKISLEKILRRNGAVIGKNCDIESGLTFHNCSDYRKLKVGDNSHIGKNCFFDLAESVTIGNNAVISMNTSFITHIDMKRSELDRLYPARTDAVTVGDDCYIGANSIILPGVKLGSKCFAAASSTITESFEGCSFVAGSPAVKKKKLEF
ncbi:MAG TPA: acyltransferase [Ignavibacteria bacterium]|nr:acyltransferase [Ignavibacteria bacterium]